MDVNFTDFTKNDPFSSWTSSGDISSSTDTAPPRRPRAHHKRPHYDPYYGEPPAKRAAPSILVGGGFKWNLQMLAAAADAVESGGKSPVSALNELGVRVAYCVLRQGGPAHCPSFHVAVTVADMRFEGWGHSKREARAAAARSCLAALLARAGRVLPSPAPRDFTSDELGDPTPTLPERAPEYTSPEPVVKAAAAPPPAPPVVVSEGAGLFGAAPASPHKSPINVLYESYSGLTFTCTFGDGSPLTETQAPLQLSHSMRFKVVCQIKEHKFEGYGSSKKLAKLAAARSALAVLEDSREDAIPAAIPHGGLHQTLADHIGKLVNEKFNELMKNELVHAKRKVLAGVVITTHSRIEDARVIAVTTGTKCVSGEHMSVSGRAVNDCHAEVAARRCLQRHLYAQLLQYASQPDPRQPLEDNDLEPLPGGGYQLKPSRQVHLYVSTAPCGDGRIFSPHEHHHEPDKHPNRLARGQLRTKIESGEGTIPVKNCNNVLQTWDGVMQGERLLTMSCSDKVARWCVCGLQGALLSRLLRPVYLTSLVLGSLLHPHHMYRAICGRIETYLSSLPPPFHLARPLLSRAASTEARTPARAPSFSVCWSSTAPLPEVLNASTGKLESGQPSLLCKQSMFARWHYLVRRLPLLPQDAEMEGTIPEMPENPDTLLYNEAKQMCPTYQLAKQRLIEAFEKAKLGRWIKRPLEQDQFVCEITDAEPALLFAWAGEQRAARGARPHAAASATDCDSVATTDSAREDTRLGTRTLSYYNYRNKINTPKSNNISISSRLIKARISDSHVSLNRNVVDHNCSPRVGDSCDGREQSGSDDEWDDAEIHCSLNETCVTDRKHDLTAKAAESDQSQHIHVDNDIKDITHKIKDVSLDEKQRLWSEFYKNRNKRAGRDTKDISTTKLDNISETLLQQFDAKDTNCCSLGLNTRDSIRPRGLGTKDNLADESIVLEERSVDDACLVSGRHRDKPVGTSVNSTDTVKNKHLEALREPREVRFNNNVSVESIRGERHGKENTDSIIRKPNIMNKLAAYYASKYRAEGNVMRVTPRGDTLALTDVPTTAETDDYFFNKCNSANGHGSFSIDSNKSVLQESNGAQQSVKRSLLLRRLHIYEKICTKNK